MNYREQQQGYLENRAKLDAYQAIRVHPWDRRWTVSPTFYIRDTPFNPFCLIFSFLPGYWLVLEILLRDQRA